ncbi:MAG TPA: preprotein translocase subunit YajC [Candidatus Cloacimonetes bacterium]|nr:preprotein translocase subunit YajC [Candidatus Cloacimonadota bacterium]
MLYTLLEAAAQPAPQQGSMMSSLLFFAVIMGIMYFLMIRPQQKKQKEMQKMLDAMQVNDKVITGSGIYGRVVSMKPDKGIVVLEIDDTNKIRVDFQKSAIVAIIKPESQN